MSLNNTILLKKKVIETIEKENLQLLIVFDFDGTLIDTFNSVLSPLCLSLGINLGSYLDFSKKEGSFGKYCFVKNHFLSNLKHFSEIKHLYFQELLKKYYLEFSTEIKDMKNITKSITKLPNLDFGIVSRNYIGDFLNPDSMIKNVLTSKSFFQKEDFFVKRISPIKKKTSFFQELRKKYNNYCIISIGDQIDDYLSATKAKFDIVLGIEGYDSKEIYSKHDIPITTLKDLERVIYHSILDFSYKNCLFKSSINY